MLHTISPQDMQDMEKHFLHYTAYPSMLLMEHAAQAVVSELAKLVPASARVLFLCGGGNNGGDGCAAARLWIQQGGRADIWMLKSPMEMKGDAGMNARLLDMYYMKVTVLDEGEMQEDGAPECSLPDIAQDCAAVVDALFGTGLSRPLEGAARKAAAAVNASGLPVVAVDIPSGIDGATGREMGEAIRAAVTVTFHRPKHGHMFYPGRACTGRLVIADIGIPEDWDDAQGYDVLEDGDAKLFERSKTAHKGTNGSVLVAAGSEGMAGAACLCAQAALRAGAGLVTAACPYPVLMPMQISVPCATAKVVSEGGVIDAEAAQTLLEMAKGKQALAIGPGLGQDEGTWRAIEALVEGDTPKVIDADALNLLAAYGVRVGKNTVMTPHPGEMARLLGVSTAQVTAEPVACAQKLAERWGACVLLKGATTVIACGDDVTLNLTGCEGMGTGGCGDVLTGVIAGLMAQGASCMQAARIGAYCHGRAGETAQERYGMRAMTAWDVCSCLSIE